MSQTAGSISAVTVSGSFDVSRMESMGVYSLVAATIVVLLRQYYRSSFYTGILYFAMYPAIMFVVSIFHRTDSVWFYATAWATDLVLIAGVWGGVYLVERMSHSGQIGNARSTPYMVICTALMFGTVYVTFPYPSPTLGNSGSKVGVGKVVGVIRGSALGQTADVEHKPLLTSSPTPPAVPK